MLTERQKLFCQEYLIDMNASKSAERAGYAKSSCRQVACNLLKNKEIKEYLDEKLKEIEDDKIAKAEEVLKYLSSVMRGKEKEEVLVLVGDGIQRLEEKNISAKDRIRAGELLGKRYGIFIDKLKVDNPIPVIISDNLDNNDDDEDGDK